MAIYKVVHLDNEISKILEDSTGQKYLVNLGDYFEEGLLTQEFSQYFEIADDSAEVNDNHTFALAGVNNLYNNKKKSVFEEVDKVTYNETSHKKPERKKPFDTIQTSEIALADGSYKEIDIVIKETDGDETRIPQFSLDKLEVPYESTEIDIRAEKGLLNKDKQSYDLPLLTDGTPKIEYFLEIETAEHSSKYVTAEGFKWGTEFNDVEKTKVVTKDLILNSDGVSFNVDDISSFQKKKIDKRTYDSTHVLPDTKERKTYIEVISVNGRVTETVIDDYLLGSEFNDVERLTTYKNIVTLNSRGLSIDFNDRLPMVAKGIYEFTTMHMIDNSVDDELFDSHRRYEQLYVIKHDKTKVIIDWEEDNRIYQEYTFISVPNIRTINKIMGYHVLETIDKMFDNTYRFRRNVALSQYNLSMWKYMLESNRTSMYKPLASYDSNHDILPAYLRGRATNGNVYLKQKKVDEIIVVKHDRHHTKIVIDNHVTNIYGREINITNLTLNMFNSFRTPIIDENLKFTLDGEFVFKKKKNDSEPFVVTHNKKKVYIVEETLNTVDDGVIKIDNLSEAVNINKRHSLLFNHIGLIKDEKLYYNNDDKDTIVITAEGQYVSIIDKIIDNYDNVINLKNIDTIHTLNLFLRQYVVGTMDTKNSKLYEYVVNFLQTENIERIDLSPIPEEFVNEVVKKRNDFDDIIAKPRYYHKIIKGVDNILSDVRKPPVFTPTSFRDDIYNSIKDIDEPMVSIFHYERCIGGFKKMSSIKSRLNIEFTEKTQFLESEGYKFEHFILGAEPDDNRNTLFENKYTGMFLEKSFDHAKEPGNVRLGGLGLKDTKLYIPDFEVETTTDKSGMKLREMGSIDNILYTPIQSYSDRPSESVGSSYFRGMCSSGNVYVDKGEIDERIGTFSQLIGTLGNRTKVHTGRLSASSGDMLDIKHFDISFSGIFETNTEQKDNDATIVNLRSLEETKIYKSSDSVANNGEVLIYNGYTFDVMNSKYNIYDVKAVEIDLSSLRIVHKSMLMDEHGKYDDIVYDSKAFEVHLNSLELDTKHLNINDKGRHEDGFYDSKAFDIEVNALHQSLTASARDEHNRLISRFYENSIIEIEKDSLGQYITGSIRDENDRLVSRFYENSIILVEFASIDRSYRTRLFDDEGRFQERIYPENDVILIDLDVSDYSFMVTPYSTSALYEQVGKVDTLLRYNEIVHGDEPHRVQVGDDHFVKYLEYRFSSVRQSKSTIALKSSDLELTYRVANKDVGDNVRYVISDDKTVFRHEPSYKTDNIFNVRRLPYTLFNRYMDVDYKFNGLYSYGKSIYEFLQSHKRVENRILEPSYRTLNDQFFKYEGNYDTTWKILSNSMSYKIGIENLVYYKNVFNLPKNLSITYHTEFDEIGVDGLYSTLSYDREPLAAFKYVLPLSIELPPLYRSSIGDVASSHTFDVTTIEFTPLDMGKQGYAISDVYSYVCQHRMISPEIYSGTTYENSTTFEIDIKEDIFETDLPGAEPSYTRSDINHSYDYYKKAIPRSPHSRSNNPMFKEVVVHSVNTEPAFAHSNVEFNGFKAARKEQKIYTKKQYERSDVDLSPITTFLHPLPVYKSKAEKCVKSRNWNGVKHVRKEERIYPLNTMQTQFKYNSYEYLKEYNEWLETKDTLTVFENCNDNMVLPSPNRMDVKFRVHNEEAENRYRIRGPYRWEGWYRDVNVYVADNKPVSYAWDRRYEHDGNSILQGNTYETEKDDRIILTPMRGHDIYEQVEHWVTNGPYANRYQVEGTYDVKPIKNDYFSIKSLNQHFESERRQTGMDLYSNRSEAFSEIDRIKSENKLDAKYDFELVSTTYAHKGGTYALAAPFNMNIKGPIKPRPEVPEYAYTTKLPENFWRESTIMVFEKDGDRTSLFSNKFYLQ